MRFPALATRITAWLTKASFNLPRHSRLRLRLITLATWRAFNALSRGDVDLVRTITHPEAIWDLSRWDWPEDSLYHGRDGAVLFNEHFDVVAVEELDHGAVFIHVRQRGIGRASGAAVERDVFELVRMRDGLVWRGIMLPSRAEATAAGNAPYGPSESSRV